MKHRTRRILDLTLAAHHYNNGSIVGPISEEITHKKFGPMLDSFVSFASDHLGIESLPNVRYKTDDDNFN